MTRIPAEVLAGIRLDAASVRIGLELVLDDERHPVSMDNALAFIQRLLDEPTSIELMCDLLNHRGVKPR